MKAIDASLYFELTTIILLMAIGIGFLFTDLPGWNLISISAILAALSFTLRKANKITPELATIAEKD